MKFPKILVAIVLLIAISCEKDENEEARLALAGHWHIWDFEPNADSPEEESYLAKEAILQLVEIGCDPMEFSFKVDDTLSYRDGMNYLSPRSTDDGVSVNCASQYDDKVGTYDYDFETLVMNFENETITMKAKLEDKYLITEVENMLVNGVEVSGKLYYIIETGDH